MGCVELSNEVSADSVTDRLIEYGFITRPLRGNAIQISPPFITTDQEVRDLLGAVRTVLDRAKPVRSTGKAREK